MICFLTKYRLIKNPQKALRILLANGYTEFSNGFKKNDNNKLIQKLEHSWHNNGLLIYGIVATLFLMGLLISVSLQAYDTPKQHTK